MTTLPGDIADDPCQYIRDTYHVPARVGGRVQHIAADTSVWLGTITGADRHLYVTWDVGGTARLHPTWHVTYLGEQGYPVPRREA